MKASMTPTVAGPPGLFTGNAAAMASYYDTVLLPGLFGPWADDLVTRLPMRASDQVLDVACGTGALSASLAARLTAGGRVLGVDLAPAMLSIGRGKSMPDTQFCVGDAVALPVKDGQFDGVVSQQGLQFVPDRAAAVREMRRAARGGAWLAVACWTAAAEQVPMLAFRTALQDRGWAEAAAALTTPFSLADPTELAALVADNGFGAVRVETVTLEVHLPEPAVFAHGYAQVPPFQSAYLAATQDERDAFVDDVAGRLAAYKSAYGMSAPMTSSLVFAAAV